MIDFEKSTSRRTLVKGASLAMALGAVGTTLGRAAYADEAADNGGGTYTYADTVAWDAEYDVVVLGMGFAGIASATAAADAGASVLICEKASDGEAGGNSRVCGQMFAWGHDDEEATKAYLTALAADRKVPEDVLDFMSVNIAHLADSLVEHYGWDRSQFKSMEDVVGWLSPEYPEFPGADKISLMSINEPTGGSSQYQSLRSYVGENYGDKLDVWFQTPGIRLIKDPVSGTVVGVTVNRNGEERNVRALGGVCVCTGGFEHNAKMMQDYLNMVNYAVRGGQYNDGDGIVMCQEAGARLWHMTAYEGSGTFAHHVQEAGDPSIYLPSAATTGASIAVGRTGARFMNETETKTARHGHLAAGNNMWETPRYPAESWVVMDESQMAAVTEPGGFDERVEGDVVACATVADVAAVLGCEEGQIQATLDDFEFYLEAGRDYELGRDVATMRAFDGAGYYVVPLSDFVLNTQGGPERNAEAQVLDHHGDPIPHLYSAGEMGGFTSCMYQGGCNCAECHIMGWQAGKNAAAGVADELPPYGAEPKVESVPAHLGDESDLGLSVTDSIELADNELMGVGTGIGGDVPVVVTLDTDGAVASVTVGENSETEGIGSKAIEQLPEQFVGLSTAEEIDAVDGVSGATITSNALKTAVKNALGL